MKKKIKFKRASFLFFLVSTFLLGVFVYVLIAKIKPVFQQIQETKPQFLDVTFTDPHQALIFWKTGKLTTGHVQFGETAKNLSQIVYPINRSPSYIHTVVLDKIPWEGVFIKVYTKDSKFNWLEKPIKIKFETEENE